MKRAKRWATLLVTLSLVLATVTMSAAAYETQYDACAQELYELGLFKGAGVNADGTPDFQLDREPTREEALVMLIRLLGEEETALNYTGRHPFSDVPQDHWAYPYVAYGYFRGYTTGMNGREFGLGQPATANMYLTFILRALGYDDRGGDFVYAVAYSKAMNIGLIKNGMYTSGTAFYRDDCAYISYKALLQPMSNHIQTLGKYLNNKGVTTTAEIVPLDQLLTPPTTTAPVQPTSPTNPTNPTGPVIPPAPQG